MEVEEETLDFDKLIEFVKHVLQLEYEAVKARYTERDQDVMDQKGAALQRYLVDEAEINLQRPKPLTDKWFEDNKSMAERVRLRKLFVIRTYDHPELGDVYRAYVGPWNDWAPADSYSSNYFFAFFEGKLRLFSIYDLDTDPDRLGHRFTDMSLSWVWQSGGQMKQLGDHNFLIQVEPPGDPEHLEEYNS